MQNAHYKKYANIGPGGMNCVCCGPAPGPERKKMKRMWKKKASREEMKIAEREGFSHEGQFDFVGVSWLE